MISYSKVGFKLRLFPDLKIYFKNNPQWFVLHKLLFDFLLER